MGMQIGSSSPNMLAMQSTTQNQAGQKQQHVSNLFSALQSGDIASAQKSYTALGLSSGAKGSNSPLAQIGKELDKGDLANAQKIAKSMKTAQALATNSTVSTTAASENSSVQQAVKPITTNPADLASELMSDFSSASSALGLGNLVNTLV